MHCPECGTNNREGARFCAQCGTPLVLPSSPPPPPTIPPPSRPDSMAPSSPPPDPFPATHPSPPPPPPAPRSSSSSAPSKKRKFPWLLVLGLGLGLLVLCTLGGVLLALPWLRETFSEAPFIPTATEEVAEITPTAEIVLPTETPLLSPCEQGGRHVYLEPGGATVNLRLETPGCPEENAWVEVFRIDQHSVRIGGNRLYYWDELLYTVELITRDGQQQTVPSPTEGTVVAFTVTPDGNRIAWGSYEERDDDIIARVHETDGWGGQPRLITEVAYDLEEFRVDNLIPFAWSPDQERLYVARRGWGMGGYILFRPLPNPAVVEVASGEMEAVEGAAQCTESALSPDGETFACLEYVENVPTLRLWDIAGGNERRIPGSPGFSQAGDLHFSPDGSALAYVEARGDPADEYYRIRQVDVATGAVTDLVERWDADYLTLIGWMEELPVVVTEGGSERVGPEGRAWFSADWFLGMWPASP